jgi:Tfp pilus assembly protein PilF
VGTFRVFPAQYGDVTQLEKDAAAKPNDAETLANLALGYLYTAGDPDKAEATAKAACKLDPTNKKAIFAVGEVAIQNGDKDRAKQLFEMLLANGGEGYDARIRLAKIAIAEGNVKAAETHIAKAEATDPERSDPYMLMADFYKKLGREDDSLKQLEKYAYIEQMELKPVKELTEKYTDKKNWAKVKEFGEMAIFIDPSDPDLHVDVGDAYVELKQTDDAIYEFQSALMSDPPMRRPAVAQIGLARAYLAKQDKADAKQALDEALKTEPQNADALALKKQL